MGRVRHEALGMLQQMDDVGKHVCTGVRRDQDSAQLVISDARRDQVLLRIRTWNDCSAQSNRSLHRQDTLNLWGSDACARVSSECSRTIHNLTLGAISESRDAAAANASSFPGL